MEAVFGALWVPCIILGIIGIALLITELFLPGFGICGISGVLCLIIVSIMQFMTTTPLVATLVTIVLAVILIVMVIIFMRSMKNGLLFRSPIVLKDQIESEAVNLSDAQPETLIGKTGVALTPLRPSGIALIDGKRYSVETQATFTEKDSEVTVISVDGPKITVK